MRTQWLTDDHTATKQCCTQGPDTDLANTLAAKIIPVAQKMEWLLQEKNTVEIIIPNYVFQNNIMYLQYAHTGVLNIFKYQPGSDPCRSLEIDTNVIERPGSLITMTS